jgi:hypothetical protein
MSVSALGRHCGVPEQIPIHLARVKWLCQARRAGQVHRTDQYAARCATSAQSAPFGVSIEQAQIGAEMFTVIIGQVPRRLGG